MQQRVPAASMQMPKAATRAPLPSLSAALQEEPCDISAHLPLVRLASIEAAGTTVPIPVADQRLAQRKPRQQRC